jgi:hypothetical protein
MNDIRRYRDCGNSTKDECGGQTPAIELALLVSAKENDKHDDGHYNRRDRDELLYRSGIRHNRKHPTDHAEARSNQTHYR